MTSQVVIEHIDRPSESTAIDSTLVSASRDRLQIGTIESIDEENHLCTIRSQYVGQNLYTNVPLSYPYYGPSSFIGSVPEVGSYVIFGWPLGDTAQVPFILSYFSPRNQFYQQGRVLQAIAPGDAKTEAKKLAREDLYISRNKLSRLFRAQKLYPGEIALESNRGSNIHLNQNLLISDSALDEIELRSEDHAIFTTSLQNYIRAAGIRSNRGLIVRNNEAGWLTSLALKDLDDLRQKQSVILEDGSFQYVVTINKADATNITITNPKNFDKDQLKTDEFLTPPITEANAPKRWTDDLQSKVTSTRVLDSKAYVEDRLELTELHTGVLDVDDSIFDLDNEFPLKRDIDPTKHGRKSFENDLFFERTIGTLVGNDPSLASYGRVLIPNIFSHVYETKLETIPYLTVKQYADLSVEKPEEAIEIFERRQSSAFHFSFPQNGKIQGKKTELIQGGIVPSILTPKAGQNINDLLSLNIDGFYWGLQKKTTSLSYNEDTSDPNKKGTPLPASYTRFDILKDGNLQFNIAASDETYGQLKGKGTNKGFADLGFGPTAGPGVFIPNLSSGTGKAEKLAGWSIEGNIEGASKLILGRDLSKRISLAFQTYGMLYGTIGSDFPKASLINHPDEIGSNNSFNIKVEGKGRIYQGKNVKDNLSLEYRTDGRIFWHIGSAKGNITKPKISKSGDNLVGDDKSVATVNESPNGAESKNMFNRQGGLVYRTANTSLELAAEGSIHIPFVGKETSTERSVTIYTDGSIEIGNELEPIGANKNDPNASNTDKTFNQSLRSFTQKAIQIRVGQKNADGNAPIAPTRYKNGNSEAEDNFKLNKIDNVPQTDFKSGSNQKVVDLKGKVAFDLEIYGNVSTIVHGNEFRYTDGDVYWEVTGNFSQKINKSKYTDITGEDRIKANNMNVSVKNKYAVDVGKEFTMKSPVITLTGGSASLDLRSTSAVLSSGSAKCNIAGSNVTLG